MNIFLLVSLAAFLTACSPSATVTSSDVREIMKADDTNAILTVISERGPNGYTTLPFSDKRTPLIVLAAENLATNVIRLLLERGADPNATNYQGKTALIQLFTHGTAVETNIMSELILKGANIDHKQYDGWDSLHYAALGGEVEIVAFLLRNGADPSTKAEDGTLLRDRVNKSEIKAMLRTAQREGKEG